MREDTETVVKRYKCDWCNKSDIEPIADKNAKRSFCAGYFPPIIFLTTREERRIRESKTNYHLYTTYTKQTLIN